MALSSKQRDLCERLGLSEQLVEDILATVPAVPDYCNTCRQRPCVCTISEFPFGMGEEIETRVSPAERDAKKESDLMKKAQKQVTKDMLGNHNKSKDTVTFYPSTDHQPDRK
jgi:hypothetical protein